MTPAVGVKTRFVYLSRVSTEAQEVQGESLRAQRTQMEAAIHQLGGQVVGRYEGQEHATPGHERKILKELLSDAVLGKFDAVMVADYDRWSRGNDEAERGLDLLLHHGVRFFILTQEQDLEDEDTRFMLGVRGNMNKAQARKLRKASARSRISRALRGHVSSSFPPYGRDVANAEKARFEDAAWVVDEQKKTLVEKAANLYLRGKTWEQVARELGGNGETWRRRVFSAGNTWEQRFQRLTLKQRDFEVDGSLPANLRFDGGRFIVTTRIPSLLPPSTIEAVQRRSKVVHENRQTPHVRPLSRFLRCRACGSILSIHTHRPGVAYVQHHSKTRKEGCFTGAARYEDIERSVLWEIGEILSNSDKLEYVVRESHTADQGSKSELEEELKRAKRDLADVEKRENALVQNLATEILKPGSAAHNKARADASELANRREELVATVLAKERRLKDTELPSDLAEKATKTLFNLIGHQGVAIELWPEERQRKLMSVFFGSGSLKGRTVDGELRHELGIFLRRLGAGSQMTKRVWALPGQVNTKTWTLPVATIVWEAKGLFGVFSGTTSLIESVMDRYSFRNERTKIPPEQLMELAKLASDPSIHVPDWPFNTRAHAPKRSSV